MTLSKWQIVVNTLNMGDDGLFHRTEVPEKTLRNPTNHIFDFPVVGIVAPDAMLVPVAPTSEISADYDNSLVLFG